MFSKPLHFSSLFKLVFVFMMLAIATGCAYRPPMVVEKKETITIKPPAALLKATPAPEASKTRAQVLELDWAGRSQFYATEAVAALGALNMCNKDKDSMREWLIRENENLKKQLAERDRK